MLTMIQQHHIKYLHQYKGMSLRAISKETGHSFQTVQKICVSGEPKYRSNLKKSTRKQIRSLQSTN
ncbi:hypothetical protein Q5P00_30175 (plasmid) [Bacillus thuringiensis]|nr:hypothetical protein Q5P00_30175 [Bacillus thuringiensis]